jgi:DNA topoisomerase-3
MSKKLIIAEKPSVAADIARALGGFTKHDDYFENDDFVLSSAVGHLLELACPEEYEVKRGKWSFAHLPVIPPHFALKPIEKSESRLKLLTKLIKRKDVTALVNACDAGREGELIFNYIAQHAKSGKAVQRLWLQSMTQQAIKDGFAQLRDGAEMKGLADAAVCRSESDWLVGINGTRAMTAFNSKTGGFHLTTVGRVQTPTLALLVEREDKIRRFKPRPYWELEGVFSCAAGEYRGKWFDENFAKGKGEEDEHLRADRLWDEARAKALQGKCTSKPGLVTEEAKPSSQLSPLLYDLTSLQREANSRFGFSAKATLGLAQALYEKHKVLTYPRTDARALPEDYVSVAKQTLEMIAAESMPGPLQELSRHAGKALSAGYVKPTKRIFDNSKISDHFAIIPTLQAPKALTEIEAKLYDLVVKRFIAVFYPSAEFMVTTRVTQVEAAGQTHHFQTNGKVLVNPGWMAVYGKEAAGEDANLVAVRPGETVVAEEVSLSALRTKPPARYNESTLLSAMEGAGKLIDDEELKAAMQEKGLGTPATRAAIIEGLITEKYLLRDGRDLVPTAKAFQLMTLLRGLAVEDLTKPELTGQWEQQLAQMEKGQLSRDRFMQGIADMARRIVVKAKEYDRDTIPGDYATLAAPCPNCGGVIKENYRRFACTGHGQGAAAEGHEAGCGFSIGKIPGGRSFELHEAETFLREHHIGPLEGFRSKAGWPFTAELKLVNDDTVPGRWKLEFDFGDDARKEAEEAAEPVDLSGQPSLGACPKCGSPVHEHGSNYVCERSVGTAATCDFKTGKVILQQTIEPAQVTKLLATGKTDLLEGFISNKTRRAFKAFLTYDRKEGKVVFEFEPRAAKFPAKKAAGKVAAKKTPA